MISETNFDLRKQFQLEEAKQPNINDEEELKESEQ